MVQQQAGTANANALAMDSLIRIPFHLEVICGQVVTQQTSLDLESALVDNEQRSVALGQVAANQL